MLGVRCRAKCLTPLLSSEDGFTSLCLGLDGSETISDACYITTLCSAHSQLFVGTSNGLLLAMPLPKLPDSVPKITGKITACDVIK